MIRKTLNAALAATLSLAMLAPNMVVAAERGDLPEGNETAVTVEAGNHADSNSGHVDEVQAEVPANNEVDPPTEAIPAGDVDVNAETGTIDLNNGNVDTNNGLITENNGTVGDNAGTINVNGENGTVATEAGQENSGYIGQNDGTVGNNTGDQTFLNGELVETNGIGVNNGTVTDNAGYIGTNNNEVTASEDGAYIGENNGTVTTNAGSVGKNDSGATIGTNSGQVVENKGTVTTNTGSVLDNYGEVTTNSGDTTSDNVENNYGTVGTNDGLVKYNGFAYERGTGELIPGSGGTITINNGEITVNETTVGKNSSGAEINRNLGNVDVNEGNIVDNFGTVTRGAGGTIENNYGNASAPEEQLEHAQQWWEVWANTISDVATKINDFWGGLFGGDDHKTETVRANNRDVDIEYVKDSCALTVTPEASKAILGFTVLDENGNEIALDAAGIDASYNHDSRVWTVTGVDKNIELSYFTAEIKPANQATLFYDRGFKTSSGELKAGQFVDAGTIMDANFNDHLGIGMRIENPANPGTFKFMPDMITPYAVENEDGDGYVVDWRVVLPSSSEYKYRYSGSDGSFAWFELVDIDAEEDPNFKPITPPSKPSSPSSSSSSDKKDEDKKDEDKKEETKPAETYAVGTYMNPSGTSVLSIETPATVPMTPSIYVETLAPTITNPALNYAAVDLSGKAVSVSMSDITKIDTPEAKTIIATHEDYVKTALIASGLNITSAKSVYTGQYVASAVNSVMTLKVSTSKSANIFVVFIDPKTGKKTYVKPRVNKNGTISFEVPFANCELSIIEAR